MIKTKKYFIPEYQRQLGAVGQVVVSRYVSFLTPACMSEAGLWQIEENKPKIIQNPKDPIYYV